MHLGWRYMWAGAFGAAALFAVGRFAISYYLARTAPGSAYGAAGSLVLVWVYYSSLILLLGAALTRVMVRERGEVVKPRNIAVRVRTEVVEEEEPPPDV